MNEFKQLQRLMDIMDQLRDPRKGCPWDLKQDFKSLIAYTLEESYELAGAIEHENEDEIINELGDLLFHLVFYAQIGKEQKAFNLEKIAQMVSDKMLFRHPHVFANHKYANEKAFEKDWIKRKQKEKQHVLNTKKDHSLLDGISRSLPAMTRAVKIQKQVAHVGFDWDNLKGVLDQLKEEIQELEQEIEALQGDNREAIADELGDVLFCCVNLSRHLKQDPETALRQANTKFSQRFKKMEQHYHYNHDQMEKASLDELEKVWQEIKK